MAKHIKISAGIAHVNYGNLAYTMKEAMEGGADYVHADAADMHELKNLQLMGGHQIIEGIRPVTDKPIECHFYTSECDLAFIEKLARVGCNMLILPAEHFIGSPLAYIINWCRERNMKVGLTIGCYTPLSFVEESIYDIDRLHIVTHGVDETDGRDVWYWRKSVLDLIDRSREEIAKKNPKCELAVDGGIRLDNVEELVQHNPDVIILSTALFRHEKGPRYAAQEFSAKLAELSEKYHLE